MTTSEEASDESDPSQGWPGSLGAEPFAAHSDHARWSP